MAHLIISLTLWKRGTQTQSDKGCFYRLFPNTVTEFRLLQNVLFFPQYISLATESQSVESSHGYCAVN